MPSLYGIKGTSLDSASGADTVSGGYFNLQSASGSQAISLPFVWGRRRRRSTKVSWWEGSSVADSGNLFIISPLSSGGGGSGRGISLVPAGSSSSSAEEIYYLALGDTGGLEPFVDDGSLRFFISSDPTTDPNVFNTIANDGWTVNDVTYADDLSEFLKSLSVETAPDSGIVGDAAPVSVPEPSLASSLLLLGIFAIAWLWKSRDKSIAMPNDRETQG